MAAKGSHLPRRLPASRHASKCNQLADISHVHAAWARLLHAAGAARDSSLRMYRWYTNPTVRQGSLNALTTMANIQCVRCQQHGNAVARTMTWVDELLAWRVPVPSASTELAQ
jgi:hypothetical protein